MTKDLMSQFVSLYEQNHSSSDEEKDYLINCEDPFAGHKLPRDVDKFLQKVTNLHQRLQLLRNLVADLQRNQAKILTEIAIDTVLREEHDQLIATIKETSEYLNEDIQQLKKNTVNLNKYGIVTTEEKIKRDQVNVLVVIFQEVMSEYNRVQLDYRDQCKARIKRQLEISARTIDNDDIEEMIEKGQLEVFHKQIVFSDIHKAGESLRVVEDRHADIIKLEQSITDLYQIFQEIAYLVESQGDMIENIQRNVEETMERVAQTKQTLKTARKYKSRSIFSFCCPTFLRKTMCCTIL